MAPTPSKSNKQRASKQQSLTSFFSPKSSSNANAQPAPSSQDAPAASNIPSSPCLPVRKRHRSEISHNGNGSPDKPVKKPKKTGGSSVIARTITDDDDDDKKNENEDAQTIGPEPLPEAENAFLPTPAGTCSGAEGPPSLGPRPEYFASNSNHDVYFSSMTPEECEERIARHEKYVKKLGNPNSTVALGRGRGWGWRSLETPENNGGDEGEDEEEAEEEDERPGKKGAAKKGPASKKLTPMLQQYLEIKRKHMDAILLVEVGYRFQFFGEDARTASKALGLMCISGRLRYDDGKIFFSIFIFILFPISRVKLLETNISLLLLLDPSEAHIDRNKFAKASIPVFRVNVHLKRLINAGYKVGLVRQVETAALKKSGDNRNAPFERRLTNLYTKGTCVEDIDEDDVRSSSTTNFGGTAGGYLLCLFETPVKGSLGADEKANVGMIAVQPSTGDIIYDAFEDGFMRSEIETRLLHISPCEFLLVGHMTKATEKLLQHLSGTDSNVFGDQTRIERVSTDSKPETLVSTASSHVTQFYADKAQANSTDGTLQNLLNAVLRLPPPIKVCLSAMITHLTEYGLEHVFDLTKNFTPFSQRTHMLLNGTTLESLEIYRNATDNKEQGSLMWALDKTMTRFGRRLLRKWIGRPLLDYEALIERTDAVEELFKSRGLPHLVQLESLLFATRIDLERSLIRLYYGKCKPKELLALLQTLQRISMEYESIASPEQTGYTSPLLRKAVLSFSGIRDSVTMFLDKINLKAALEDDMLNFLREEEHTNRMQEHQCGIVSVEAGLAEQKDSIASALRSKNPINFVTVSGIEYLVEVANSEVSRVPASWIKISGTKKVARFHTPQVIRLISERDRHKEALAAACNDAFKDLLAEIATFYQIYRDVVTSLASLDCLLSLSKVAAQSGYVRATLLPPSDSPSVHIQNGCHPIAHHTLPTGYIPFNTALGATSPPSSAEPVLTHLITGPNMGGKSSFVRAVALLIILAQIGSFVPATSATLTLLDSIYTRMGARDNLFAGESTFMVEMSETASILRAAGPRSLVILDELGRGTSTHDGAALAQAVLHHVATTTRCLTLFITHYQNLARVADALSPAVKNVHMRFAAHTNADGEEEITFLYEVAEGMAHRSYGLNVARLARVPQRVLAVAQTKSTELETDIRKRHLAAAARALVALVNSPGGDEYRNSEEDNALNYLVRSIEEL
ncbi:DNA mismatch repair protein MSH3 [Ceratocystis lukuohia]|uniref:MutS protein homolog 3 n=1 Tax=Ceratocystis lukuohia TaxID=2019550 RepID=A0ABR4MB73_9PEZI